MKSNIPSLPALFVAALAGMVVFQGSPNWWLWAECLLALPIAVWILGAKQAHAVLVFMIAMSWLQVVGDVVAAEMSGEALSDGSLGPYRVQAIANSLAAILAVAVGMRAGGGLSRPPWQVPHPRWRQMRELNFNPNRLSAAYLATLMIIQGLDVVAHSVPGLAQPVLAFAAWKFVFMCLLAITVFETRRGQGWLALILLFELATGIFGYLGTYQNAIFIVLIALAASRARVSFPMVVFGVICAVFVVWMSMAWSVVKFEYRGKMYERPLGERIEWMVKRLFVDPIDYSVAAARLARRLGYTELFAVVIERRDNGLLPADPGLYAAAVLHVFMPRVLFPDKAVLDDSKVTTQLTGMRIQKDTSVGVGYVAEAFADFGFPGMLVPLATFGLLIGSIVKYLVSRPVRWSVRQACASAAIFATCRFETDIDKAFGGCVTSFLAMVLALKYGYPLIEGWLSENAKPKEAMGGLMDLKSASGQLQPPPADEIAGSALAKSARF